MTSLRLAALGFGLGLVAAVVQSLTLPWGAFGVDQWPWLLAAFAGSGAVLTGLLGRWTGRASLLITALALAALVFLNPRPLPSVFLVVTDTTRADHLSLHGYERETSPFLEELAARSVVFDDALSQGSHTIVSTPALLASCYPSEHGLNDYRDVLSGEHVLISEVLKEAGYYTMGLVTNPHLSSQNGFAQGYENYELHGKGTEEVVRAEDLRPIIERKLDLHRPLWEDRFPESRRGAPVFGFLFYTDPHSPYAPPDPWPFRFAPEGTAREHLPSGWEESESPDPAQRDAIISQYDASIAYWDDEFRSLVASLGERDLWEQSLLVYTSDHGEEFLEHGRVGHGFTLFEEVVHVPLMISFPPPVRFPPLPRTSRRVAGATAGIDVVPTVLEYLKLPVPDEYRGSSVLGPALGREAPDPERAVVLEEILQHTEFHDIVAVRDQRFKFVRLRRGVGERPEEAEFLFDLREDPGETVNLIDGQPDPLERFRAVLQAHDRRVGRRPARDVDRMVPDAEHLQRLRALGYID